MFVPTMKTLPEEYSPDMVYPARKTTITHSNGTEMPKIQIEDDLRHPNAAKKVPAELPAGVAWTCYTDFNVGPVYGRSGTLPTIQETRTTESTDEDMPESYGSTSTSSTGLRDEWKYRTGISS